MKLRKIWMAVLSAGAMLIGHSAWPQGSLTPPGPPAPTMKTLEQIEPRSPIGVIPTNITVSGSYYLLSNLTGVAGQNGIRIDADNVTLDLNGFSLVGVPGSLAGIVTATRINISVRNGMVRDWGNLGVDMDDGRQCKGVDLQVSNNAGGIRIGPDSVLANCVSRNNQGSGIVIRFGSVVRDCMVVSNSAAGVIGTGRGCQVTGVTATHNGTYGLNLSHEAVVKDCVASTNGIDGIRTGAGCVIQSCTAAQNASNGIVAGAGSTVENCSAGFNGNDGILASSDCSVRGCTSRQNGQHGFSLTGPGTISDCVTVGNAGNGINGTDNNVILGCSAASNQGHGIRVIGACLVLNNTCLSNGLGAGFGAGIHVENLGNRIEGNTVRLNDQGIDVDFTGNLIIRNSASGNGGGNVASNYVFTATQTFGPTNDLVGADGTITNAHPWANFSF